MKLGIGMATTGQIKSQTVFSLIQTIKHLPVDFEFILKEGSILHYGREQIVKMAIEHKCTHLLFVDSDMSFGGDAVNRLIARNKDIVGVHYNRKGSPPTTTVNMEADKKARLKEIAPDGFTTCDTVATGFVLINLDVFKKIDHPWFFFESDKEGELTRGEDYWFCDKARKAGYDIWVDLTIPVKHIGDYLY